MVYFIPKKGARLGNWLFQYSVAASIGDGNVATLDVPFARDAKSKYSDFLGGLKLIETFPKDAIIIRERHNHNEEIEIGRTRDGAPIILDGYYQRVQYLDRSKILDAFSLSDKRRAEYEVTFGEWLNKEDVTAIHVRRGDYLRLSHCHPFVGKKYFKDCLARLPQVRNFMVFSDDIEWCKSFFPDKFPDRRFKFVEGTNMVDDLYLQSLCKNNIISNSSFSWWAAYLNKNPTKIILAPSNWFGFYLKMFNVDSSGMYYEGMTVVPNSYTIIGYIKGVFDMFREVPKNILAKLYHLVLDNKNKI